ncbi:hypothetical protein [Zeaxanthinibacter enoshimensis]|uniref:Uncharacterized protein n=1 Tax=Zeaxanthinibacter enoshimensis TaxID=392009 RepID=A0A4R6TGL4_9FLAO|nr:hypothetical protein [Zeaxanthinibacter enoshimensis]TDQ28135.1 hypothetical protein CLV82_2982 [Zeaxanthinibacter enoshimensis]
MELIKDLELEIKDKLDSLESTLSKNQKSSFHFQSVRNFVAHIFLPPKNKKILSNKLYQINLVRNQNLIKEYLDLIIDEKVSAEDSIYLFKKYITVIGEFMNRHYGLSFAGGKIKYLIYLAYATVGMILDFILWILFDNTIYAFTIVMLAYILVMNFRQHKKGKIYGPNY